MRGQPNAAGLFERVGGPLGERLYRMNITSEDRRKRILVLWGASLSMQSSQDFEIHMYICKFYIFTARLVIYPDKAQKNC